jgi:lantibiotic transport system permease protein
MFIHALNAERMKIRHSPIWLAFIAIPILPAIMGTFNYLQNLQILQDQWYSLWSQHTLFSCYFFLPSLIAVYCSYLFRLEHTHNNWNLMMSVPIPGIYVYLTKLTLVAFMILITQVWIGILFILSGWLFGLGTPIPPDLISWLFLGAIGGIVIAAVQLCISLVIRSFAVPVGLGLIGGIASLVAVAKGLGIWMPYALIDLGMRANNPRAVLPYDTGVFLAAGAGYVLVCILFAAAWIGKRDVNAS